MKMKTLTALILATIPASSVFAAALDRSGQSIAPFLQAGNYAEVGGSFLAPDVSGKDKNGVVVQDMADHYESWSAALKLQPTEMISVGLIFDQPFGAAANYEGTNAFTNAAGGTNVEVKSHNITALLGVKPIKGLTLFGGAAYQEIEGDVALRGSTYGGSTPATVAFNGYTAKVDKEGGFGWVAGAAFEIPDIALKTSITYRSEVEHDATVNEKGGLVNAFAAAPAKSTEITTPQSVNLDLQTGIMADTVAFATVRWVEWSQFTIRPAKFGAASNLISSALTGGVNKTGFNLVDYSDDQWTVNAGLGRKLSDQIGASVSVGWDSGAGNPAPTLGPTEGYWNLGLGVRYSPTPKIDISAGLKYFWLGDAKASTGSHSVQGPAAAASSKAGTFTDNEAIALGVKMGYHF